MLSFLPLKKILKFIKINLQGSLYDRAVQTKNGHTGHLKDLCEAK